MYLVDTSVWISYIQVGDARRIAFLYELLKNRLAVGFPGELLLGRKPTREF